MVGRVMGGTGMTARVGLIAGCCHLILGVLACPAGNAPAAAARFEIESKHMGTTFRVVLYAADEAAAKKAAAAAFARVAELDQVMSDYKKDSELMTLCRAFASEVREPVPISVDLFFVLSKAEELSKAS